MPEPGESVAGEPSAAAVAAVLDRVLASEEFANAPRLQRFLRYVVEGTLAGRARELRAYAIAVDVFDRPADFDPQSDSLVRVEAGRLRQKLAAYAAAAGSQDPLRITLPKGGYVPAFEPREVPAPAPTPSSKWRRWLPMAAMLAVIATIAAGSIVLWRAVLLDQAATSDPVLAGRPAPAIGVLPFTALDADPASAATTATAAAALTALVTADLVRFRQLFVLAERSAATLTATAADPIQAAAAAALDFVVDGTVRQTPGGLVVTASLIETADGQAVWSDSFSEPESARAVLDLEDEIARAIVTALAQPYGILSQQLTRAADQRALPDSLASYRCILLADRYYASYAAADYATALQCLKAALEREPDYAHGWAYLAYLLLDDLRYGYARGTADLDLQQAAAAARRAVALEPENAVAQRALAAVLFTAGDVAGFRRQAERALALNPNDSDALADLGGKLAYSGEWERGLAMRERAMQLNPAHPPAYHLPFVFDAIRRGDDAAALVLLDRIDLPDFLISRLLRAAVLGRLGPSEATTEAAEALLALDPEAAARARDYLGFWNMDETVVEAVLQGLDRAGLSAS